ncbi:hypothetical protein GGR50DRAFT_690495 [Xylaria sp. CBS 124048]|nr:hypothetical protein GGR50DRAFT_690495 [Xylaria sp. CBS 124048]
MQFKQFAILAALACAASALPTGEDKRSEGQIDGDAIWLWKKELAEKESNSQIDGDAIWLWKKEQVEKKSESEIDNDAIWLW